MASNQTKSERFFFAICIIGAFAILSSTMSKNPVLNPFAESLGTPEAFMGFVAAASTLPGVLISLPAGSLSDIFGRRKVLLASSMVFASAPFFYLLVNSWWQLALVRFYHGFATAIFVPVARAAIAEYFPSKRGEKISIFTSATIVGRAIAPFLGGLILSITLWNFHALYLSVGVFGVTTFLLTLLILRENEKALKKPSVREKYPRKSEKISLLQGWRIVLGNLGILVASSIEAVARYVYGALEFFFTGYLKNIAQLDASLIGTIMGMQLVLIPLASPFVGRLSDRIGRRIPILLGLGLSSLSIFAIPYTTQFLPLLLISVAYGLGFVMVISTTPALVGDLAGKGVYGASMGLLATIMDIGQMLGPIVTGLVLASFGYGGSFISLGGILIAFGIIFTIYQKISSLRKTQKGD